MPAIQHHATVINIFGALMPGLIQKNKLVYMVIPVQVTDKILKAVYDRITTVGRISFAFDEAVKVSHR